MLLLCPRRERSGPTLGQTVNHKGKHTSIDVKCCYRTSVAVSDPATVMTHNIEGPPCDILPSMSLHKMCSEVVRHALVCVRSFAIACNADVIHVGHKGI